MATKKVIIHRYSLSGGTLELELPARTPVKQLRAAILRAAQEADAHRYGVQYSEEKHAVALYLHDTELLHDNVAQHVDTVDAIFKQGRLNARGKAAPPPPSSKNFVLASLYRKGKLLNDSDTLFDVADELALKLAGGAQPLSLALGQPERVVRGKRFRSPSGRSPGRGSSRSPGSRPRSPAGKNANGMVRSAMDGSSPGQTRAMDGSSPVNGDSPRAVGGPGMTKSELFGISTEKLRSPRRGHMPGGCNWLMPTPLLMHGES